MKFLLRRWLTIIALATQLSSCVGDGLVDPPAQPAPQTSAAPAPAPASAPVPALPEYRGPATRSFYMGFTPWPADLSNEGVALAKEFAHAHGDIVSVMFIGGIPWQEALDGKPFSKDVQENMAYRPPPGKKLFLSISP